MLLAPTHSPIAMTARRYFQGNGALIYFLKDRVSLPQHSYPPLVSLMPTPPGDDDLVSGNNLGRHFPLMSREVEAADVLKCIISNLDLISEQNILAARLDAKENVDSVAVAGAPGIGKCAALSGEGGSSVFLGRGTHNASPADQPFVCACGACSAPWHPLSPNARPSTKRFCSAATRGG